MDFLDPQKERRSKLALLFGYGLVAVAIAIASVMLLYQTDGYCVSTTGAVDRCGLVFVASQPSAAEIRVDGKLQKVRTNTKFNLRTGEYLFNISLAGYQAWQRSVQVDGGDVQRFDYPLLVPVQPKSAEFAKTAGPVYAATQSLDKRWLVTISDDAGATVFKSYDMQATPTPRAVALAIPASTINVGTPETGQEWSVVGWSSDNRHVLLTHTYTLATTPENSTPVVTKEYILLDRQTPTATKNVTKELALAPQEQLTLFDKKPTLFYGYNTETKVLRTLNLNGNSPITTQLERVIAYKTDGSESILYVTDTPPSGITTPGKVSVVLQRGEQVRVVRQFPAGSAGYVLDMAQYDGAWYVVIAAANDKGAYVYRDPIDQQLDTPSAFPAPMRFLKLANPDYVAFSATAQFILGQHEQQLVVYDIKNTDFYRYSMPAALDAPQTHVRWMDGHRLFGVVGGKLYFTEYDSLNPRTLTQTDPRFGVFFAPDFRSLVSLQTQSDRSVKLVRTSLIAQ